MTAWRVDLDREAAKALRRLSRPDRERMLVALAKLPDEGDIRELVGSGGLHRLRVGTWRVIFRVDRDAGVVQVVTVSSRGSAYKPSPLTPGRRPPVHSLRFASATPFRGRLTRFEGRQAGFGRRAG